MITAEHTTVSTRKTYNLFNFYGWLNVYYDLRFLFSRVWEDSIFLPLKHLECRKYGHDWYRPIGDGSKVCARCHKSERNLWQK